MKELRLWWEKLHMCAYGHLTLQEELTTRYIQMCGAAVITGIAREW